MFVNFDSQMFVHKMYKYFARFRARSTLMSLGIDFDRAKVLHGKMGSMLNCKKVS